jgi:hypothetical protein
MIVIFVCVSSENFIIMDFNSYQKEGEYGWCTSYTRMNIELINMLKSLQEGN